MAANRAIHLVDIENLAGAPRPMPEQIKGAREAYLSASGFVPGDLVVVACNHGAALDVGLTWPGIRLLMRSGPNGADLALLDVIADEHLEQRFSRVVIGSGDGIFTDAAAWLGARDVAVDVVARGEALAKRLRLAARATTLLPTDEADWEVA